MSFFSSFAKGSNPWKTVVDSVTTSGLRLNGSRKADPCEICMDKKKTRKDKEICSNCNGLRKVDQGDDTVYGVAFVLDSNGNDDFQKANFLKDPQNAHTMLRSTCQWVSVIALSFFCLKKKKEFIYWSFFFFIGTI